MSAATYRQAAALLREALDVLGPYRGRCLCGCPDARHRVADAVTGRLLGGDDALSVADDYGVADVALVWQVAALTLGAHVRLHALTRGRAAALDREVYQDVLAVVPAAADL